MGKQDCWRFGSLSIGRFGNVVATSLKKCILIALVQMAGLCLCVNRALGDDNGGIFAGGLEWTPSIQISEQYNDNIFEQETTNIKGGAITTIDPALTVGADDGANSYSLGYRLSKGIYSSSRRDDYLDQFYNADANLGITRRLNMDLHLAYNRTHNTRGSIFTGLPLKYDNPYVYHESIANATISYGVNAIASLTGSYSRTRYDNHLARTRVFNYDTMGANATFSYPIAPNTRVELEARYKRFNHQYFSSAINLNSNDQSYYVGITWNATAQSTGYARIGYMQKKFSQAGLPNYSGMAWELNVQWKPLPTSTWTLATSSAPQESGGYGTFQVQNSVYFTWIHQWSSRISHKVSLEYVSNRIFGKVYGVVIGRRDRVRTADLSIDYQLGNWLTLEPAYDYTVRNSNVANASFKQNIWWLYLTAKL